jgi:RNA polymerase sigma factor (sigma-70 family)
VEPDLTQTSELILRGRNGDRAAIDDLLRRYRPRLEVFLRSRLPRAARGVADTQDLVQDVCLKACQSLGRFEDRGIGSFWVFLRTAARHRIVDLWRHFGREEERVPLPDDSQSMPPELQPGPISWAIAREDRDRFEKALEYVSEKTRRAVLMRIELDLEYADIARDCGFPSEDAARMAIKRGLAQVVAEMAKHGQA